MPLFAIAITQAKNSKLFDEIIVSTDDEAILSEATKFGATFILRRPQEFSGDDVGKPETIRHAILEAESTLNQECNFVVDLDVTSPLRNIQDIQSVVDLIENSSAQSIISVSHARRNPYFNMIEVDSHGQVSLVKPPVDRILSRQKAPVVYEMNAAIHAWRKEKLIESPSVFYKNTGIYLMPMQRGFDIDSEIDFQIVDFLSKNVNPAEWLGED